MRRLLRDPVAVVSFVVFLLIVTPCALAPLYATAVAHTGPNQLHVGERVRVSGELVPVVSPASSTVENGQLTSYEAARSVGPTLWHADGHFVLGADVVGRDIAVRLLYGGRFTLAVGLGATALCLLIAILLALAGGYYGGWLDWALGRVYDVIWGLPALLIAIALGISLQFSGFHHFGIDIEPESILLPIFVIGLLRVPYVARPLRARVLELSQRDFVAAARGLGARPAWIMYSEILPNLASDIVSFASLLFVGNVLLEASISYLGVDIGNAAPNPSWGGMIADGEFLYPGIALVLTTLSLNILGERVRDALDPHATRRFGRLERIAIR